MNCTIEPLDQQHLKLNGVLVDFVAIETWYRSKTWPPHSPAWAILTLRGCLIGAAIDHERYLIEQKGAGRLIYWLAVVSSYGYPVDRKAFRAVPDGLPYYQHHMTGQIYHDSVALDYTMYDLITEATKAPVIITKHLDTEEEPNASMLSRETP